ncbi:MAG: B12-binding domain-containing radical SAM protein [Promethearchaeota archaeon]
MQEDVQRVLVVDALASGTGRRRFTRDFIGAGPRAVAGLLESSRKSAVRARVVRVEALLGGNRHSDPDPDLDLGQYSALFVSAMTMDEPACTLLLEKWRARHGGRKNRPFVLGGPITLDGSLHSRLRYDLAVQREGERVLSAIGEAFGDLLGGEFAHRHPHPNILVGGRPVVPGDREAPYLSKSEWNSFPAFVSHAGDYPDVESARVIVECVRGCSNFHRPTIRFPGWGECPPGCGACHDDPRVDNCPRGVPGGCGYCATTNLFGPPKSRDLELLLGEVRGLCELGARQVVLGASDLLEFHREELVDGGCLTTPDVPPPPNYDALEDLVEGLLGVSGDFGPGVHFSVENLKATLCTREALEILARLPNPQFSIGVETGDAGHARELGRPGDPERALEVVRVAKSMGFRVHAYFIHSLPGLDGARAENTVDLMGRLAAAGTDKVTIYKFQPLPGTYFQAWNRVPKAERKRVERFGRLVRDEAIRINRRKKEEFVGRVVRVRVAEAHFRDPSRAIGRPVEGGPLVEVVDGHRFLGQTVDVAIVGVVSDKLLLGQLANGKRGKPMHPRAPVRGRRSPSAPP